MLSARLTPKDTLLLLATICMFVLVGSVECIVACTCIPFPSVREMLERSDAVFTGKVVGVKDMSESETCAAFLDDPDSSASSYLDTCGFAVTFQVEASWKGVKETTVLVKTGRGYGDCGIGPWLVLGESFLVFADVLTPTSFYTSMCTGTVLLKHPHATEMIKELGVARFKPST